jgi:hypothetical protein
VADPVPASDTGLRTYLYRSSFPFDHNSPRFLATISRVLEMQTFLVELVDHFEFEMSDASNKIKRQASVVMVATVRGEEEKGAQMPLKVKFAPPKEDF